MMNSNIYANCAAEGAALERVRYYPRQLIDATTLTTDQEYMRYKAREHNRLVHGWGVVCGLQIKPASNDVHPWQVTVCPGYALSPQGDAITIASAVEFDLATGMPTSIDPCAGAMPCPPIDQATLQSEDRYLYLAARYTECYTRPERVLPAGCSCDESVCEYARIRDGFELKALFALPDSHQRAAAADKVWCEEIKRWSRAKEPGPAPVPVCPECVDDPWVVLARIQLPDSVKAAISPRAISYDGRRVLYSVTALQTMVRCI
jgi:hypothetical protein